MRTIVRSPKLLGAALRRARRAAGLTQTALGARAGVRQATVSALENGEGATLDTLFAVLGALDLDLTIAPRAATPPAIDALF